MRYLFLTNTPAHVHLYRHTVRRLDEQGHDVLVLGRDYGCTRDLLECYDLPHEIYGVCETTKFSLLTELPSHFASLFRQTLRYDPDLVFGIGSYAAPAGALARARVVLVTDSEPVAVDQFVSRLLADAILTPYTFQKDLGNKHFEFRGFKETAYLHPEVFEADDSVRADLGVGPEERFALVRLNAFGSHHDVAHGGFTPDQRRTLLERLTEELTVFVSDEGGGVDLSALDAQPFDVHPGRLHDALAESSLLVTDTQTMATEAALLGTPVIRSNSFVGDDDMGNFQELAARDLVYNTDTFEDVLATAQQYATEETIEDDWKQRRDQFVGDLDNLTEILLDVAECEGRVDSVDALDPWSRPSFS
jgi:predicted glycosyltransferase